jgi:hypothetical protein
MRAISISITLNFIIFLKVNTFKFLSSNYFLIYNTLLLSIFLPWKETLHGIRENTNCIDDLIKSCLSELSIQNLPVWNLNNFTNLDEFPPGSPRQVLIVEVSKSLERNHCRSGWMVTCKCAKIRQSQNPV